MHCSIYRSRRKTDAYLYCAVRDDFSAVPKALLDQLGALEHAMDLELTPERRLAREDAAVVLEALAARGWYLQMPQREDWAADWRAAQTPAWGQRGESN